MKNQCVDRKNKIFHFLNHFNDLWDIFTLVVICIALVAVIGCFLFGSLLVHAEESSSGTFSLTWTISGGMPYTSNSDKYTYESIIGTVSSSHPLFMYKQGDFDYTSYGYRQYYVGFLDDDGICKTLSSSNDSTAVGQYYYLKQLNSSGNVNREITNSYPNVDLNSVKSVQVNCSDDYFHCDSFVFDSLESAQAYYDNGDWSGVISRPDPTYDDKHNFKDDTYTDDIPVPQLSNLTHNSFKINNMEDGLYLDVIVESKFYGVKHVSTTTSDIVASHNKGFEKDTTWVYSSHYWNFTDKVDISWGGSASDTDVDISKVWKVDNEETLVNDFVNWSAEYPHNYKLPDYSFWSYGGSSWDTWYTSSHVYNNVLLTASTNKDILRKCGQASTTFYVRFTDANLRCGKWYSYTYSEGTTTTSGLDVDQGNKEVEVSPVESDKDGNPVKTDPITGIQDPDTGDIDYTIGDTSSLSATELWSVIKNLVSGMGDFPQLIADVLGFLPSWVLSMIAVGIAAIVILRFVGR
jgi:hypothetical protein